MSTFDSPGCVILLIDESNAMSAVMGEIVTGGKPSTKTNAERLATAVNGFLGQLATGPDFDVALVGYQTDAAGQPAVGSRWGGSLAGRDFVSVRELSAAPLRVEARTRKIPAPGGFGVAREEPVDFPVWYAMSPLGKAPQIAAFNYCRELLSKWLSGAGHNPGVPVLLHVFLGSSGDGNPQMAIQKLADLATPAGPTLLMQAHLAASAAAVAALYPSNPIYLTAGSSRDLFRRASPLPADLVAHLKKEKLTVGVGCRALLYNGKIVDLLRMLGLIKIHVSHWPSKGDAVPPLTAGAESQSAGSTLAAPAVSAGPAANANSSLPADDLTSLELVAPTESPALLERESLVIFLLDRSVADPYSGNTQNSCAKLQDYANGWLKQISKLTEGAVDVAIVSYGLDHSGQVEVRTAFEGPLAGQTVVRSTALADGAIRVEEFSEEIDNNAGSVITVPRKKPIYFDVEATGAAPAAEAFAAVARIASEWSTQHPAAMVAPIVMHLTRGCGDPAALEEAALALQSVRTAAGPVSLFHLVVTETPHKSVVYPDVDAEIQDPALHKLWELSSRLLAADQLAAGRPRISAESRGIVINGKFDVLVDGLKHLLSAQPVSPL